MKLDWPTIHVFVQPFIVFAAIHFLPWWLSTPIAILATMLWLGSIIMIGNRE